VSPGLLVVDDDPFIRRLVTTTLHDVTSFALIEAGDGEEAVAMARRTRPAIVLLDIDMPGLDGIEVCRALRADPRTRGATIVVLTAARARDLADRVRAAGADEMLAKPFSPLALLQLIDRLDGRDA
jgi:CheY-like chemotaxis protein